MADITKTVQVLVTGDSSQAQKALDDLSAKVAAVGGGDAPKQIDELSKNIDSVKTTSEGAAGGVDVFKKQIDDLAQKAGLPKDAVDGLSKSFASLGVGPQAAIVLSATAIASFISIALDGAKEVNGLRLSITNLTGSSEEGAKAVTFIKDAVARLKFDLGETANLFTDFRAGLDGTAIDANTADRAFSAVLVAVKGFSGEIKDAKPALTAFADVIKDGSISSEELDGKLRKVPGALQALQDITGTTYEELKQFAEEGLLTADVIDALITRLNGQGFEGQTPIADAFNDLTNIIKDFGGEVGSGAALNLAIQAIANFIRGISLEVAELSRKFELFQGTLGNIAFTIRNLDFSGFSERQAELLDKVNSKYADQVRQIFKTGEAATDSGQKIDLELKKAERSVGNLGEETKKTNKALEDLTLKPDKFKGDADKVVQAFSLITTSSKSTSAEIIGGLLGALTQVSDPKIINALGEYAKNALQAKGDTQGLEVVTNALNQALSGSLPVYDKRTARVEDDTKALEKAARESQKTELAYKKLEVELEKIASNERIKVLEFTVQLETARITAEIERVKTAFESLNTGIQSTGDVLKQALGDVKGASGERLDIIKGVIEEERRFRREQFQLQKELVEQQIERLKAQNEAIRKGDALIKIDGSGLAPQLEAFMWEVLRAIQVRVNADGLPLLLGEA